MLKGLFLASVVTFANCCSHRTIRVNNYFPEGVYSITHNADRACEDEVAFEENLSDEYSKSKEIERCREVPSFLKVFDAGYTVDMFQKSPMKARKALEFTCTKGINWNGKSLPDQFEYVELMNEVSVTNEAASHVVVVQGLTSFSKLEPLIDVYKYMIGGESFATNDEHIHEGRLLTETISIYRSVLHEEIPTRSLALYFRHMPQALESNYLLYYNFLLRFGTHYMKEAIFGGKLMVAVRNQTLIGEIGRGSSQRSVDVAVKGENTRKGLLHRGGTEAEFTNVGIWRNSIIENPVPIFIKYMPISKLLKTTEFSEKVKNLEVMIENENRRQEIERVLVQMELCFLRYRLSEFVTNLARSELRHVCVSREMYKMTASNIAMQENFYLTKFFINCGDRAKWMASYNEYHENSYYFFLVEGVCFTNNELLRECNSPRMRLPSHIKCVKFYHNPPCMGIAEKVYHENDLENVILKYTSFALCNETE